MLEWGAIAFSSLPNLDDPSSGILSLRIALVFLHAANLLGNSAQVV